MFADGFGKINAFRATIHLKPGAVPVFKKSRPVPNAMREKVATELDRLEISKIITKVERSNWARLLISRRDQSTRICGDYKVTVNPHFNMERHLLPTAEYIFAKLAGRKQLTKLDVAHAYNQTELDDESKQRITINTHKGLCPSRLCYGISSAPAIFQCTIVHILAGIEGVTCYLDDILIMAWSEKI